MDHSGILRHLTEFKEYNKEKKEIMKDINTYKKQHHKRLKYIKDKLHEKEKLIVEYMKMNNHPGLNYKGMMITLSKEIQGNRNSVKKKEKKVAEVLQKYNIAQEDPIYNDIKGIFILHDKKDKLKLHNLKG
jgi:flagellar biosynthesis chaperone FliJ